MPEEVEFLPYKHMHMTHFVSCYKHTPLHVMFVCSTPSSSSSSSTSLPRKRYRSSSNCRSNSSSSLVSLTGRLDLSPNWLLSSNRLRMSYLDHINKHNNMTLEDQFMEGSTCQPSEFHPPSMAEVEHHCPPLAPSRHPCKAYRSTQTPTNRLLGSP